MNGQQMILKKDGSEETVELVLKFKIKEFNKEYVIYTKNEKDPDGNILLYSATLVNDGAGFKTTNIETEEEWNIIKELIRKIARGECG